MIFVAIASLLASAGAAAMPRKEPSAVAKPLVVPKLIQSCDAHRFETIVHAVVDGATHNSKVKLCGVEGQSDAGTGIGCGVVAITGGGADGRGDNWAYSF
jgi:hypothetical protein